MFVLSHASVAAQLEAFFSVVGGLGNSKEAELWSGEDIVAAFVREYQSEAWKTLYATGCSCIYTCVQRDCPELRHAR
jgi:hypothetical protein